MKQGSSAWPTDLADHLTCNLVAAYMHHMVTSHTEPDKKNLDGMWVIRSHQLGKEGWFRNLEFPMLSWRTQVQFSVLRSGSSQMLLTPAPGDLVPPSGLFRNLYSRVKLVNFETPVLPCNPCGMINPSFRASVCKLLGAHIPTYNYQCAKTHSFSSPAVRVAWFWR